MEPPVIRIPKLLDNLENYVARGDTLNARRILDNPEIDLTKHYSRFIPNLAYHLLFLAIRNQDIPTLELILNYDGALETLLEKSPDLLYYTVDHNKLDILNFLLQNFNLNDQIFSTLDKMILQADFQNFVTLSNISQFNFNTQDEYGDTLLHHLIIEPNYYRFLEHISHFDVNMNIQNFIGQTPFDVMLKQLYNKENLTLGGLVEEHFFVILIDEGAVPDIEKINLSDYIEIKELRLKGIFADPAMWNFHSLDFLRSSLNGLSVLLNIIDLLLPTIDHVYSDLFQDLIYIIQTIDEIITQNFQRDDLDDIILDISENINEQEITEFVQLLTSIKNTAIQIIEKVILFDNIDKSNISHFSDAIGFLKNEEAKEKAQKIIYNFIYNIDSEYEDQDEAGQDQNRVFLPPDSIKDILEFFKYQS